jgi:hypothetical protein
MGARVETGRTCPEHALVHVLVRPHTVDAEDDEWNSEEEAEDNTDRLL